MADREAGSGKEQKRVATNRTKTDLRSWRRQNSWSCHLTCPTERKADFDIGRLQIFCKFIACWQICWHLKPLYLLAFQLFLQVSTRTFKKLSSSILENKKTTSKKFQTPCWHLCCQCTDKLPAGTKTILSLSGTGKKGEMIMEKMMNTKTEGNTFTKKIGQTVYVVRYHFNENAKETMQEKINRMLVTEASRMAVY